MVERIDQRERRGAVERSAVVESRRDADRRLIDVRDAEVDFSHGGGFRRVSGSNVDDDRWASLPVREQGARD
jgi:hypothetical protein